MGRHNDWTPRLIDVLEKHPDRDFTCAQLSREAGVPKIDKKFVRRALTDDPESEARHPMAGVKMWQDRKDGLWRFQAEGGPQATESN
jgi:hypothetical protein